MLIRRYYELLHETKFEVLEAMYKNLTKNCDEKKCISVPMIGEARDNSFSPIQMENLRMLWKYLISKVLKSLEMKEKEMCDRHIT